MSLARLAHARAVTLAALALIVAAVVGGCNLKSGGFVITKPAHMRFVNVLVDGGALNVVIDDDDALITGLPFEGLTVYQDIRLGQPRDHDQRRRRHLDDRRQHDAADRRCVYTYLVYGTSAAPVGPAAHGPHRRGRQRSVLRCASPTGRRAAADSTSTSRSRTCRSTTCRRTSATCSTARRRLSTLFTSGHAAGALHAAQQQAGDLRRRDVHVQRNGVVLVRRLHQGQQHAGQRRAC